MKKLSVFMYVLTCSTITQAAVVTYTDRTTWQNNTTTPATVEDFNSFVTEDGFGAFDFPPILDLGDFTMNTTSNFGFIDIPLVGFDVPNTNIDGTTLAVMGLASGESLFLNFDSPMSAFGAEFRDLYPEVLEPIEMYVNGQPLNLPVAPPSGTIRFFGFTSTTPFTQVEIRGMSGGDQFGMDNVEYAPIPEPSSCILLSLAALGSLAYRTRKKRPATSDPTKV